MSPPKHRLEFNLGLCGRAPQAQVGQRSIRDSLAEHRSAPTDTEPFNFGVCGRAPQAQVGHSASLLTERARAVWLGERDENDSRIFTLENMRAVHGQCFVVLNNGQNSHFKISKVLMNSW